MSSNGIIEINNLRLFAHHGVFEQERTVGNEFEVTVRMSVEMEAAMINDSLDSTVNYAEIISLIKREMATPSKLIENVAWRIASSIRSEYQSVESVTVRVEKLTPPIPSLLRSVAVEINL